MFISFLDVGIPKLITVEKKHTSAPNIPGWPCDSHLTNLFKVKLDMQNIQRIDKM